MQYSDILPGIFISRPNRFIAHVQIGGVSQICHVKNTGRCAELLLPGAKVYVQKAHNPARKTKYDLISIYKGDTLVNMDSTAPNKVFGEWLAQSGHFGTVTHIKPEAVYGASRLDFYFEGEGGPGYAEVKGVTLEENGVAMFPDAPTERGVKHINELMTAKRAGYTAVAAFVIQMDNTHLFHPNWRTHAAFGRALAAAAAAGAQVLALDCTVTSDTIVARRLVPIKLEEPPGAVPP